MFTAIKTSRAFIGLFMGTKGSNNQIMNNIEEVADTLAVPLHQIENEKEIMKSMCHFHWL